MKTTRARVTPRPFLKWVGGKGQLLDTLLRRVKQAGEFHAYHEPFVGGAALFFELTRRGALEGKKAYLSDTNSNLIETYRAVKENVESVIALLKEHKLHHTEHYFYEMRRRVPAALPERAARIIYLNKTCFNGLYRENSKGEFNTPFGKYVNPMICDEHNLRAASEALAHATLECRPFETVLRKARSGDFVYFDPPYHPVSKTASFTSYDKSGFAEDSQRQLAKVFTNLDRRDVRVLLSNSDTPLITELYKPFKIQQVFAKRLVNSRADRRGKVSEALVRNF